MATDKHGMGIPVPSDSTKIHQFPAISRESINAIAAILAGGLTAELTATVAAEVDDRVTPAVAAEIDESGLLGGASDTAHTDVVFGITDQFGRRSWLEIDHAGRPTAHAAAAIGDTLPAAPAEMPETVAAFTITDQDGRRSWLEIDHAGRPTAHALELLQAAGLGTGAGTVTDSSLAPALAERIPAPFTLADTKTDAYRRLTVRDDAGRVRPLTSDPLKVSFWGDSLLDGWPRPPFLADQSNSLPGIFATLHPAGTIYNGGESGQSADEIAIRQAGLVPMLAPAGGSIPASGSVTVTTDAVIAWRLDRSIADTTGTLAGVPGRLTRDGDVLTFTRDTAGDAVPVPAPAPWESFGRTYADGLQVILAGRNDIGYTSAAGPIIDRVVNATRAMVEALTPQHPRVLLLGTTTATSETAGSTNHTTVTAINDTLAALYPEYFFDYRAWLVNDAIYALGITPTAEDLEKIDGDTLPPSIMTDSVHYSPATAAAAAERIHTELTNRGWL